MNRGLTNKIRYVMDEWLPPAIRDSKWFMYPFYHYWFKGQHIHDIMNFKRDVYGMSEEEFIAFYQKRNSRAKSRPTDLSQKSIRYMLDRIDPACRSVLDVGCGNGYLLERVQEEKDVSTTGCDVFTEAPFSHSDYIQGDITKLPLGDGSYDLVFCCHTLEHVLDLRESIDEIVRVAARQVMVVVPCQRYNFYSLDEHVHFFPLPEKLAYLMRMENYSCEVVSGDLVFIGIKS